MNEHKNGLDLRAINPKIHQKYSSNLFRWLGHTGHKYRARLAKLYMSKDGAHWIGDLDDQWFTGTRLMSVLCDHRAETMAYPHLAKELEEIPGFWAEYTRIGRCAIDVEHRLYFVDDNTRWKSDRSKRHCQWCGNATRVLKRWTEAVKREQWESQGRAAA